MNYKNLIKIALKALANNKFRGFLTMLGIIIGVASVIAMLAIGQGSKRSIREQISEMGSNMIMVHPGNGRFGGVRQSASSMQTLKLEDYRTIEREASYISACSPTVSSSGQAIYGANNAPTTLYGVNGDYMTIRKYSVGEGEMFTDHDVKTAAKVCVVGKTVVDNLFVSGEDPLGKTIRFDKIPLKIVGVLSSKGYNSMGQDQDDLIIAPYTTVQKRVLAITYLHGIFLSALTEEASDKAIDEIAEILRQNHKIKPGDEDDFEIRSQEELSSMLSSTTDLMTVLLACIAGISLLVGGIGVMNIMLVSVTERTREIGLKKAIGAKKHSILAQFLTEASVLTSIGGIIGVGIGIALAQLISRIASVPVAISSLSIVVSVVFSMVVGIVFGLIPSIKAANLNPIDALRYE